MTAIATFADRKSVASDDVGEGAVTLLTFANSDGRACVTEVIGRPGMTQVDVQKRSGNCYLYVVAGTWTIAVADSERRCLPDTTVFAPADCSLLYGAIGETPGKLLIITMPI